MFFGDPTSLGVKNDALACVQMAIAMQNRVAELANEWRDSGVVAPLRCRIGIHTGIARLAILAVKIEWTTR